MLESTQSLVKAFLDHFCEVKAFWKRTELIDNLLHSSSQVRLLLPETGLDPKNSGKKVAFLKVPSNEGITSQLFNGQRHQIVQPDILPDHDPEILDRKIAERFSSESMAGRHQVGGEIRLSPFRPFKFLKCFVSLLLIHA